MPKTTPRIILTMVSSNVAGKNLAMASVTGMLAALE
jgi:hypothetical protein